MKQYIFGIDLGGTTVKLGLFTLEGKLLDKWEIPTRTADAGAEILPDIAAALKAKQEERGISVSQVAGVGLGVPGAVLEDRFVKPCVNLQGWGGDAAGALSALCGCPVKVVNDANAAALGEMWLGGGKGYSNVVFVTLGTGVGGGIIVDSKLLTGVHGSGGEIGHIKVNPAETVACGCGKKGCLEQYTSATGVVREARRRLAASDAPSLMRQSDPLTSKDVFDCAKAGDALALEVVDWPASPACAIPRCSSSAAAFPPLGRSSSTGRRRLSGATPFLPPRRPGWCSPASAMTPASAAPPGWFWTAD